ncbi:MAG: molecular chaperone TorD family protein [Dehalococcoidia bacterium]|nr:molecular chaperone TorD family protein [Dehalococcoidia bacterium]
MLTAPNETGTRTAWSAAIDRAIVYGFFSRALAYPWPARLEELREQLAPAVAGLLQASVVAPPSLAPILEDLDEPVEALQAAHRVTFSLTASNDCPDYETAYSGGEIFQQTAIMADIAGFYRAHGLETGGDDRERPDHASPELEFMSIVCLKEANALAAGESDRAEICRESAELFLRDHLACWAPALGRRLALCAEGLPLYGKLGVALAAFLDGECERLGVIPARSFDAPAIQEQEPDDGCCGTDADEA